MKSEKYRQNIAIPPALTPAAEVTPATHAAKKLRKFRDVNHLDWTGGGPRQEGLEWPFSPSQAPAPRKQLPLLGRG